jgi:hypothetical protein
VASGRKNDAHDSATFLIFVKRLRNYDSEGIYRYFRDWWLL